MNKHLPALPLFLLLALPLRAADPAASATPAASAASAAPAAPAAPAAWKEYTYKEDLMAFSMPGEPQVSTQQLDDGGTKVPIRIYTLKTGDCVLILSTSTISAAALAKEPADQFMKSAQQGALSSMDAKSTSEKQITIDNNPGYESQFSSAQFHGVLRVYIAGGHVYQIGYLTAIANPLPPEGDRFLASFHLLKL